MEAEAPANIVAKFMTAGWLKTEASSSVLLWPSSKLALSRDPFDAVVTQKVACSIAALTTLGLMKSQRESLQSTMTMQQIDYPLPNISVKCN